MTRGHHHHHSHHGTKNAYKYRGGTPFVPTPPTSANWVIFPYDKVNKRWNTSNYQPSQTGNRASVDEIERFLNEVNEPLTVWYKEYGAIYEGGGIYLFLFIFLIVLLPIFIIYVCWIASAQGEAEKKLEEVKQKVRSMIQEKGSFFAERGLIWGVPGYFPQWIELWVGQGPHPDHHVGIQMGSGNIQMAMFQQNQGGMMFNQQQQGFNMGSYQQSGYPQQGNGMGGQGFHKGNMVVPIQEEHQQFHANMY